MARDLSAVEMKANILAHAAVGKVFNLPTILTTSADTGMYILRRMDVSYLHQFRSERRPHQRDR